MTATAPFERRRAACPFTLGVCRDHTYAPRFLRIVRQASPRRLRAAARATLPFAEPESWLDVGTGDARFPEAAKEVFPYTAFDGLDPTHRVLHARVAERIEEAHVGQLTDPRITARLRTRYDVVSMLRHLELSPDPRAELRAALAVLRPGGHLVLELPNPRSAFALLFGVAWIPQSPHGHLHLLPLPALQEELRSQGCTIVATDRRTPHIPYDLAATTALVLNLLLGPVLALLGAPLVAVAWAIDLVLAPVLRLTPLSNAYRIIARKEPTRPAAPSAPAPRTAPAAPPAPA
ncbi:class I SAM-dependent methyltransferase [Streptomyces cyaneochromogenes]|uniref:Class I SAM-dependent methyltransferase n=1 Tax=Streptomyces cyaneochromogenes TaxID=2496836 RepID=A0A3Q9EMG8_9ACTN|nr:class I SAM-dependent methyltransferase [Streptomyces cyaneochromogenes]AZQ34248.1 class I SAM-dependent methyltransferase [Streptomyces cyaneochromogenes]